MQEAISKYVHDGDRIVFGGFVTNRKPYAAVHEIIRQKKKDLYLQSHSMKKLNFEYLLKLYDIN